ncbi:unannotated protein [freshwater metagenome]|uniref:Unannotated protein n=1 Tax=freshwater metagenome TaxID=449393 RepID=A0A6J6GQ33_9ZZZZ
MRRQVVRFVEAEREPGDGPAQAQVEHRRRDGRPQAIRAAHRRRGESLRHLRTTRRDHHRTRLHLLAVDGGHHHTVRCGGDRPDRRPGADLAAGALHGVDHRPHDRPPAAVHVADAGAGRELQLRGRCARVEQLGCVGVGADPHQHLHELAHPSRQRGQPVVDRATGEVRRVDPAEPGEERGEPDTFARGEQPGAGDPDRRQRLAVRDAVAHEPQLGGRWRTARHRDAVVVEQRVERSAPVQRMGPDVEQPALVVGGAGTPAHTVRVDHEGASVRRGGGECGGESSDARPHHHEVEADGAGVGAGVGVG